LFFFFFSLSLSLDFVNASHPDGDRGYEAELRDVLYCM